jgi:hypothetical protein
MWPVKGIVPLFRANECLEDMSQNVGSEFLEIRSVNRVNKFLPCSERIRARESRARCRFFLMIQKKLAHWSGKQTFQNRDVKVWNRFVEIFSALQTEFGEISEKAREQSVLNPQADFRSGYVAGLVSAFLSRRLKDGGNMLRENWRTCPACVRHFR